MSQPRNRWIVQVILALIVLAFVGGFVLSLVSNTPPSNQNTASTRGTLTSADQKSKLEDEVRGYELVLQREPENQTALYGLFKARLQLLKNQKEKSELKPADIQVAIEPLEKLAKLNPEQSEYSVLVAQVKQSIGDREGAAQAYRSVLSTKPGDLKALQGMVALLISQQRPEAAIGLLQETLSNAAQANTIQPGSVDIVAVQVLLGSVHASQKRYAQASSVYNQAIKKDPKDFRPVVAKAMLLKQQGKDADAKLLFDSAAALAPAQYKDEIKNAATASPLPNPAASPAPPLKSTPK